MKKKSLIPKYTHQGKHFDNMEDYRDYLKEWPYTDLSFQDIERLMNTLKKQIQRDIDLYHRQVKCGEFNKIMDKAYDFIMQEVNSVAREIREKEYCFVMNQKDRIL